MASSFVSFGVALAMAMQVASDQRDKPKAEHADVPAVLATKPGVKDSEQRRRLVPRLSQRSAANEASTIEDSGQRQTKPRVSAGERKTLIIRLNHVPAVDTTETIEKWLEAEAKASGQAAATVVAVVITNALLVSGSSEQLDIIRDVVHELDRPSPQIRVRAMLADLTLPAAPESLVRQAEVSKGDINDIVAELKERADLRVLAKPELLAANNQSAFLQFGSRVPRVTGASVTSRGRTNQVKLENVGTILGVTGRVTENDFVTLEIDLERSHLGPEDEGTAVTTSENGPAVRAPQVKTLTLQTTVSLRSGQTVLLGGMVYQTEQRWGELLLLLQPEILQPNDGP